MRLNRQGLLNFILFFLIDLFNYPFYNFYRIWVFIGDSKDVKEFIKLFKNYNYHLNKHFIVIVDSTDWVIN